MKNELTLKPSMIINMDKQEIIHQAQVMVDEFDVSLKDPLVQFAIIAKFQILFETVEKGIKQKSIDELHKLGGKHNVHGVEFAIAEVGTSYDYTATKKWNDLEDQISFLKRQQKEIEGFCKAITNFTTTVDPDTGEAHEFYPASKKSTTSIKKTVK